MALVNRKKKRLQQGEIIVNAVVDSGATGQDAAVLMSALVAEATQPNTYVKTFGNTLFISHVSEDKQSIFLRIVNVDVHKNLTHNVEAYLRDAKINGAKTVVYADPDSSHVAIMEHINKQHFAVIQMERSKKNGWYVFVVQFPEDMKQQNTQQPEE